MLTVQPDDLMTTLHIAMCCRLLDSEEHREEVDRLLFLGIEPRPYTELATTAKDPGAGSPAVVYAQINRSGEILYLVYVEKPMVRALAVTARFGGTSALGDAGRW